jgi:poly(3-hydroxybutyrate) depolymerase
VGGIQRHYLVVVPPVYDGSVAVPIVFIFHGKGNDGALEERISGFTELAGKENSIAVYPDGLDHVWNGGRKRLPSVESGKSDDVAFVSAMIDDPVWAKTAGKTAMSINATELMWDFLEKHPKP